MEALKAGLPSVQAEHNARNAGQFKYIPDAGDGISSNAWTHMYLWDGDGELLLGWNSSACADRPVLCSLLEVLSMH